MKKIVLLISLILLSISAFGMKIETSIIINENKDVVWRYLTDFDKYNEWNPQIRDVNAELKEGGNIVFSLHNNKKVSRIKSKITKYEPGKKLQWNGGMEYIFAVTHTFQLDQGVDGATIFIQTEEYKGIFAWMGTLFGKKDIEATKDGFESVNKKLKEMSEEGGEK